LSIKRTCFFAGETVKRFYQSNAAITASCTHQIRECEPKLGYIDAGAEKLNYKLNQNKENPQHLNASSQPYHLKKSVK